MLLANYIRVAWRSLTSKKLYSGIKVGGLAMGLCVGIMILLYVSHELSFDGWHKDSDKIFSLKNRTKLSTDTIQMDHFSYFVTPSLQQQNSSVEATLRVANSLADGAIIQSGGSVAVRDAEHNLLFADSNFFSFFSYQLLAGHPTSILLQPFSAVISEDMAMKYFGNTAVVGKQLKYNDKYLFQINGIMKNMPSNSSIQADFVLSLSSFNSMEEFRPFVTENHGEAGGVFMTYLKLRSAKDADLVTVNATKLMSAGELPGRAVLQPITATHIEESGKLRYLKLFPLVAGLVLLMALINYMSLTTARAIGRGKEISIRKTLGANYKHIAWQFYIESALYALVAFILAVLMFLFLHSTLFSFLDIKIDEGFLVTPVSLIIYFGLLIITILLSGSYPAFILSRYNPATGFRLGKQMGVRRVLTVIQFVIAGVLIVCSIIIRNQLHYFKNADTGVNKNNVLMIPFQESMGAHYQSLRAQVADLKEVQGTGTARYPLYRGYDMWFVDDGGSQTSLYALRVDEPLIDITGLKWKYKPEDKLKMGAQNTIVLNEAAVKRLNLGNSPVGKFITMNGKKEVIGIVKDFNFNSLHSAIAPLALIIEKGNSPVWGQNTPGCLFVKLSPNSNIASVVSQIKKIYAGIDPLATFEYRFLDDTFNNMYKAEEQLMNIFDGFTVITILIAALGLLGLATSAAEQRTKEIGVRKTLGANVIQLVLLLSKEFIKLVLVSLVFATPLAWYLMKQWLQQFAYRVEMKMWMFTLSASLVLTVAIIAIGWQVLKAALLNPVKALKITSD